MNAELFIKSCKARDKAKNKQEEENMTTNKLKRFDETANIFAYGIISEWTEELGLCTYAVADMIDQTVCDFDKVHFMDYIVEEDKIFVEYEHGECSIYLGHDDEGRPLKCIVIVFTDLAADSVTFYKYNVGTEPGSKLVELECVEKRAEGAHMIYYVENGLAKVRRNDYRYEITFKNDRILQDKDLSELLFDSFFTLGAHKANDIIQGLVYKFGITSEEFTQMGDVCAKINEYAIYGPFSQVCYHNGQRGHAIFRHQEDVYPLRFN